jgi:hypothetical protein
MASIRNLAVILRMLSHAKVQPHNPLHVGGFPQTEVYKIFQVSIG